MALSSSLTHCGRTLLAAAAFVAGAAAGSAQAAETTALGRPARAPGPSVTFAPDARWKVQMRSQPSVTPVRRLAALVVCALLLGAASIAFDAATAHAATIGRQKTSRAPATFPIDSVRDVFQYHHPRRLAVWMRGPKC